MIELQAALSSLEIRESELLSWGANAAAFTKREVLETLDALEWPVAAMEELIERGLLLEVPGGGYRTRAAETVRLLASLKQAFRQQRILKW